MARNNIQKKWNWIINSELNKFYLKKKSWTERWTISCRKWTVATLLSTKWAAAACGWLVADGLQARAESTACSETHRGEPRFGGRAQLWGGGGGGPSSRTVLAVRAPVPTLSERAGGGRVGGSARSLALAAAAEIKGSRGSWRTTSALLTWFFFFFPSRGRQWGRNKVLGHSTLGLFLFVCLFRCFFLHITLVPNNCRANYLQQQSLRGGKGLQLSPLATAAIRTHLFKMNESVGP